MEVTVTTGLKGGAIRRLAPVELLLLTQRMVREARTARAAAIGDAARRAVRLLSSAVPFTSRDTSRSPAMTTTPPPILPAGKQRPC
jgi:hypothetical protein